MSSVDAWKCWDSALGHGGCQAANSKSTGPAVYILLSTACFEIWTHSNPTRPIGEPEPSSMPMFVTDKLATLHILDPWNYSLGRKSSPAISVTLTCHFWRFLQFYWQKFSDYTPILRTVKLTNSCGDGAMRCSQTGAAALVFRAVEGSCTVSIGATHDQGSAGQCQSSYQGLCMTNLLISPAAACALRPLKLNTAIAGNFRKKGKTVEKLTDLEFMKPVRDVSSISGF